MSITLSSMSQLLRHLAGHLKTKKKTEPTEYGVPGMKGHGRGASGIKTKSTMPKKPGVLKSPKIKVPGANKYGVISKNIHASARRIAEDFGWLLEGLPVDAAFRKKHGVPPAGKGPHSPSDYKLPMPPASHPLAKKFAKAVLSRAKKTKGVSPANVAKQVRKANRVLYGKPNPTAADKTKKRESAITLAKLREYIPEKPMGSWERVSQFIAQAAQQSDEFGGPVDDQAPYSDQALRSWDINVWASFPTKNAVIIANEKTGKLWYANYAIDDGEVEFSNIKPVVLSVKATEAVRRRNDCARDVIAGLREAGAPKKLIAVRGGVVIFGKCVEGMHIAGSAEEAVGKISPRVSAIRKHVKMLGRMVGQSPCPCGSPTHRPKLIASFPESKTCVTDCESGMHSVPYGIKNGKFALGSATKVKAKLVPVKSARESSRLRESGASTSGNLTFYARIREAKIDDKGAHADCVMLEEGPGNEADGHYYPADTIKQCVEAGVFEGDHAFADHPTSLEDRTRPERSVRDLIGWWSEVHAEEVDGKVAMCGTYNIEIGNEFALNKMREAQTYAKKYPTKPGYVGFSINAGGISEPQEIDGKTYNVVTRITESVSTDMVTRAGAGGKMRNLKEVSKIVKAFKLEPAAQKVLEAAVKTAIGKYRESDANSAKMRAKEVRKILEGAGFSLSDDQDKALDKALGLVDGGALDQAIDKATGVAGSSDVDDDDDDEEEDMGDIEALEDGGDDDLDVQPDNANADDDDEPVEAGKRESAKRRNALIQENATLKKTVAKLQAKEAVRAARRVAEKLAEEFKVPAAARAYFVQELLEVESGANVEKKMRERATAINQFIGSVGSSDSGIDGVPARMAEAGGSALIKI